MLFAGLSHQRQKLKSLNRKSVQKSGDAPKVGKGKSSTRICPGRKEACQQLKEPATQITSSFTFRADLVHPRKQATQKGACTMSTEDNTALDRRGFDEDCNKRKLAVVDELNHSNVVTHNPPRPPLRVTDAFYHF